MNYVAAVVAVVLWSVVNVARADVTLGWDPVDGAEGYKLYVGPAPDPQTPTAYDVGTSVSKTLVKGTDIVEGTQYEAYVTAYTNTPEWYESDQSNHVRFVDGADPQVITVPGTPTSITIQFE